MKRETDFPVDAELLPHSYVWHTAKWGGLSILVNNSPYEDRVARVTLIPGLPSHHKAKWKYEAVGPTGYARTLREAQLLAEEALSKALFQKEEK